MSEYNIRIADAYLKKGIFSRRHRANVAIIASTVIPSRQSVEQFFIDFWVNPPFDKKYQSFSATVFLVDNFGNYHAVKDVYFRANKKPADNTRPAREKVYLIKDPIEKSIVSILQNEVSRYDRCGRTVGGLGSVFVKYNGQEFRGVGSESWTPDVPKEQYIVPDPDNAKFMSDNVRAIVSLSEDREKITKILTRRIDRRFEYHDIAYFFVAVSFAIGCQTEILPKIKCAFLDAPDYSFSNALMILSGFLRYLHHEISEETLDQIEIFIEGISDHTFFINERICAIRARRIN